MVDRAVQLQVKARQGTINVRVIATIPQLDVAILERITNNDPEELSGSQYTHIPLELGNSDHLQIGQSVRCVGFPGVTKNLQASVGTISSRELNGGCWPTRATLEKQL